MDINYLLALQDFRNGPGACLAGFFTKMTFLGEVTSVIVIMAIIYWCLNKELGTYFILGWGGNRFVNSFLKVTLCAYRPWIRDGRIIPYGDAMTTATGYSFPSGLYLFPADKGLVQGTCRHYAFLWIADVLCSVFVPFHS